jgi:hypothetical protein
MFDAENFELPMEKQLKLRIINDEINHCENVEVLQESLKDAARLAMRYQHMIFSLVEKKMVDDLKNFDDKIGEILKDTNA